MIQVKFKDIQTLNELTRVSDSDRDKLTSTLLTVYAAATSGLFILVTTHSPTELNFSKFEKTIFLIIALSAILIVFLSLLEKLLSHFAGIQVAKEHVKRVKEGTTDTPHSLTPNKITTTLLTLIPWLLLTVLMINILAISTYIVSMITG